jgi:hypothetical protein
MPPEQQIHLEVLEVIIPGPPGAPGFGAGYAAITLDVVENGNSLIYTFTRNAGLTRPLTVNYLISGTSTEGDPVSPTPGTVTFAPGAATAEVIVSPRTTTSIAGNETFALSLVTYYPSTSGAVMGTLFNAGGGTPPPSSGTNLTTNNGDRIITLSGDYLVLS